MKLILYTFLAIFLLFATFVGVVIVPALLPIGLVGVVTDSNGRPTQLLDQSSAAVTAVDGNLVPITVLRGDPTLINARPSQFALGLSATEAYAACGPAAAIGFARELGYSPTVGQVMSLARSGLWDAGTGMHGSLAEESLLGGLGIPSLLEIGPNWPQVVQAAQVNSPVILDTPGHYYLIDAYDPQSGRLHVGTSGTDLVGGREWMLPNEINSMPQSHGAVRSIILMPSTKPQGGPS